MTIASGVPVRDALDSAGVAIRASGSDTPRLDAEVLLAHVLGVRREALFLDPGREVAGPQIRDYQALVRRRAVERAPVAYLVGTRGFRHLELAVDPRALIPRPETELLVEAALGLPHGARVLDVGTGSGAIALALADERPDLAITATDVDEDALAVARENAARLGLDVTFAAGDLLDAVPGARFDAVLSNPPYIPDGDRAGLPADVRDHEPPGALFAGADGLDVYRRLIPQAAAAAPLVAVEVGAGQAAAVEALMRAAGLGSVEARPDLAGILRVVVGRT
ncbi:peptide chain release factor N(5)-glutamine methyltransferase [Svornostia abyssi]|uniref:Release factor glutamine methyltransferase n=1 Tax=Svornostia abyssi TaxID=2898438 RepID=A0ABY5PNC7_9ACTN|nr:peptide chain release factor N(5)-glutamine methyltransferase [Parviterribacteraceae bacterium J379]